MNVLLLSDDMDVGGVPRHIGDLANGLHQRGVQVAVAASDGPFRNRIDKQIPFLLLPLSSDANGRKNYWRTGLVIRSIKGFVSREGCTILHSHKRYSDLIARVAARLTRVRHISTCHNTFDDLRFVSVFGDVTIACCNRIAEMLQGKFGRSARSIKTVYHGIGPSRGFNDLEKLEVRKRLGFGADARIILSVGHLTEAKDRTTLLNSVALLDRSRKLENVVLVIVGEGTAEERLRMMARELGIERRIRFLPALSDVEALVNASEFCVLSSIQEGLPYVILEAAALCKPTVSTNVGGISEFIIHGKSGLLVPPRAPEALAQAVARLLDDRDCVIRLGLNARERVFQRHSLSAMIDQTIEIYREVLGKN